MRTQWCREHIDEAAEACGLAPSTVAEAKQAAKFCDQHSEFSELPTKPIITLIRIRDDPVRERAIIKCKQRLNGKTGAGRGNTKKLTEREIKKIIDDSVREIRMELVVEIRKERETSVIKEITEDEITAILQRDDPEHPALVIANTTQAKIDEYFEMMVKIGCGEDIPKHSKRITMMIENKTLVIVGM